MQKANSAAAVAAFVADGDPSALTVPEGCTIITIRALSAAESGAASRGAGRKPQLGAVVAARKGVFRSSVGNITKDVAAAQSLAVWMDALDDDEATALEAWESWESARFRAIAMAGLVSVEDPKRTYTAAEFFDIIASPALLDSITQEIGYRVQAYSGLGTRPKGLLNSPSGSERPSEAAACLIGDVTSALTDCDDNVALVEAASMRA